MEANRQVLDQCWSPEISHSDGLQGLYLTAGNLVICPLLAIGILTHTHTHTANRPENITGLTADMYLVQFDYFPLAQLLSNVNFMAVSWRDYNYRALVRVLSTFLLYGIRFHGVFVQQGYNIIERYLKGTVILIVAYL